jgi:hypothetical protein
MIGIAALGSSWRTFAEQYSWTQPFVVALFGSCSTVFLSYCPSSCSQNNILACVTVQLTTIPIMGIIAKYHIKINTIFVPRNTYVTVLELTYLILPTFQSLFHESWLLLTCVPRTPFHVFLGWPYFFLLHQAMAVEKYQCSSINNKVFFLETQKNLARECTCLIVLSL